MALDAILPHSQSLSTVTWADPATLAGTMQAADYVVDHSAMKAAARDLARRLRSQLEAVEIQPASDNAADASEASVEVTALAEEVWYHNFMSQAHCCIY